MYKDNFPSGLAYLPGLQKSSRLSGLLSEIVSKSKKRAGLVARW